MSYLPPVKSHPSSSEPISTGLAAVDQMLGVGGLARGTVIEMFGPPDCGKTTLALNWVAAAQAQGQMAVFVDAERALNPEWAVEAGVSLEDMVILRPDSGPQAVAMLEPLLRTFTVDLVVVDSAAALVSAEELEMSIEEAPLDAQTDFLARTLRRLRVLAERGQCCLLFLNQTRMSGDGDARHHTPGSRVLALHAAVRISIQPGRRLNSTRHLRLSTIKNKLAPPFAEADVELCGARAATAPRKPVASEQPARLAARTASS